VAEPAARPDDRTAPPPAPAAPAPAPRRPPSFGAQALAVAAKDLRIEWRSREIVYTMAFLAVVIVLAFAVAFAAGDAPPGPAATSGILWLSVVFSGGVALARAFDREREGEAVRALLLTPVPRSALFLGKLAATVVFMLAVVAIVAPLCALLFRAPLGAHAGRLALLLGLGTLGFATVGSVLSAGLLRARSRGVLLSTLLYPVVTPLVLAGARGTALLLDPAAPDLDGAAFWTHFLLAADVLFLAVALWAFEPIAAGE
jgi:heme exporter protein CcmB